MSTNRFIEARKQAVKKVKFLGQEVDLVKLSVGQVMAIQELSKKIEAAEDKNQGHVDLLIQMVRMGAPEFEEISDEDIMQLPMEELSELSNEIMKYSGLGNKSK